MPGKLLIIDTIATNRIATKVKLTAACYQVEQAATGAEALAIARRINPDLILCSSHLPDMTAADFAGVLRKTPGTRAVPLIVETDNRDAGFRFSILSAGADDILQKPYEDQLLLARLRSLLRLRQTTEEMTLREGASHALGLAEEPESFTRPGRVALVAATADAAATWKARLKQHRPRLLAAYPQNEAMRRIDASHPPDVVALFLSPETSEAGLQLLADLRAKPETRDTGVLVLTEGFSAQRLAADALDRGANDVITEGFGTREVSLRLDRLVTRKHTLERLHSDMRDGLRAAITDPLTGLHNRRYAMPRLTSIADAALRSGTDFAAMVIDVDHFKLINDRFGHAAGDDVLMRLSDVLRDAVRDRGLLARIGGEEFLVVLPDTSRSAAQLAAKRICQMVRDTAFPVTGRARPLQVTVSIGVALLSDIDPDRQTLVFSADDRAVRDEEPPMPAHEAVLDRADKALYGAKALGRNQVTLCNTRSAA